MYNPLCKRQSKDTYQKLKKARADRIHTTARMYRIRFTLLRDRRACPALFTNEIVANLLSQYFQSSPKLWKANCFFDYAWRVAIFVYPETTSFVFFWQTSIATRIVEKSWNPSVPICFTYETLKDDACKWHARQFWSTFERFRKQCFSVGIWPANTKRSSGGIYRSQRGSVLQRVTYELAR